MGSVINQDRKSCAQVFPITALMTLLVMYTIPRAWQHTDEWNSAIDIVIIYTCASPAVSCETGLVVSQNRAKENTPGGLSVALSQRH